MWAGKWMIQTMIILFALCFYWIQYAWVKFTATEFDVAILNCSYYYCCIEICVSRYGLCGHGLWIWMQFDGAAFSEHGLSHDDLVLLFSIDLVLSTMLLARLLLRQQLNYCCSTCFALGFLYLVSYLPNAQAQDHMTSSYGLYWIQHQNDPSIDASNIFINNHPNSLSLCLCCRLEKKSKKWR